MLTLENLDITDESAYAANGGYPHAEFDLLRREEPVFWYRRPGFEPFWVLTRHEDIAYVSRNPKLFSSAQRVTLDTPEAVEMFEAQLEARAEMFGHAPDMPPALSYMDAPHHRHLRQVMAPCFTPKAINELEERFHELAGEYAQAFTRLIDENGTADVAKSLSARLPVAAICELVGAPLKDWDDIFEWTEGTTGAADPDNQRDGEDAEATFNRNMGALNGYVAGLVQQRMAEIDGTGTDVLSRLARARIDGEPLSFHEILYTIFNLLVAGIGTTRNATTGGIQALLENPDQVQKLIEDPSLIDGAVEEILRWTSIAVNFVRTATQDTEIGGRLIRKGETVAMWYPAANRDEAVFEDPHRFDVTRDATAQIAFGGHGEHVCLGHHLARLELRAILRAVLPLLPELELVRKPEFAVLHLQAAEIKRLVVRRKER
ncbi:cytochrome P450 [Streptomyces sp. NBC_00555]|uniref:cytochrome P450 n=1 Tax=unclassified Streptomyces TaxID=2593676 RepID=UPI00214AEC11|nr:MULTISPECIES: cytochrome P450 [unclassified Streptomyces]MCX5016580.1 cytochrome P450 [Streptomyces sp. NBC_00555]UUU45061.1 cytochrome P450 [Streptomyces sp. NBC_00162]